MNTTSLYCPYCGKGFLLDSDFEKDRCFCLHCGHQIYIGDITSPVDIPEIIEESPKYLNLLDQHTICLDGLRKIGKWETHSEFRGDTYFVTLDYGDEDSTRIGFATVKERDQAYIMIMRELTGN